MFFPHSLVTHGYFPDRKHVIYSMRPYNTMIAPICPCNCCKSSLIPFCVSGHGYEIGPRFFCQNTNMEGMTREGTIYATVFHLQPDEQFSNCQGDVQLCQDICPDQHFYTRYSIEPIMVSNQFQGKKSRNSADPRKISRPDTGLVHASLTSSLHETFQSMSIT